MELVTPHLKSVLKNYQHSATNSLHGPGTATLIQATTKKEPRDRDEPLDIPETIIQPPQPFPIQQLPILTTPDTSRSERTETMLEGESISCFVVGGEKRLCLPQVLNSVLRDFTLHQINQECDRLQIYCSRCTPEQLNELKNTGILPHGAPSCGLIKKTDAERLCSALVHACAPIVTVPVSKAGGLSFRVYHECFGKCTGVCTPTLYSECGGKCVECVECRGLFTAQQFVCHAHKPLENRTCHWGFDSGNWRAYLHVARDEPDRDKCARLLDALKERQDLPPAVVACDITANGHKRKQIQMLEPEILKADPLDLPIKKSKLDEYAAYLYAATLDPLYIHAAMYEQWSNRPLSAFRPVTSIFSGKEPSNGKTRHHSAKYYKDQPPVLQHPERVVPLSESERFERSFQPNVALAPALPVPPVHRYNNTQSSRHHHTNNHPQNEIKEPVIKQEEIEYSPHEHLQQHQPAIEEPCPITTVISKSRSQPHDLEDASMDRTRSAVVDSTVPTISVVQSTGVNPNRYNSEIELSTDTDDSLSDMSTDNPRKTSSDVQRVLDALIEVPNQMRDRVLDIVKRMACEQNRMMQCCHEKDERIAQLEQRVLELESNMRQATGGATSVRSSHSEYDVTVTSSRAEVPIQDECTVNISEDTANTDSPVGSSCVPEATVAVPSPEILESNEKQQEKCVKEEVKVMLQESDVTIPVACKSPEVEKDVEKTSVEADKTSEVTIKNEPQ